MSSSPPTDAPAAVPDSSPGTARWRSPQGWSLRARLVATMIALLAVLGLVVGATAQVYLRSTLYRQLDVKLHESAFRSQFIGRNPGFPDNDQLPSALRNNPPPGAERGSIALRVSGTEITGGLVAIRQQNGSLDLRSDSLPADTIAQLTALPANGRAANVDLGELGDFRVVVKVVSTDTRTITGLPLADTTSTLLRVAGVTGGAVLLMLLVAGFAGALIVRRTLTPLARVAATATKVSELTLHRGAVDLAQRVPEADTDLRTEVGQVGAALNRMLDHVDNALQARQASEMQVRQFVADASHELRTPLAAIRGYAELSRRSHRPVPDDVAHVLRRVESEAKRMTTLVEDLLLLARLDAGRPLAQDPVDLCVLVVDTVSDAHATGPRHHWQLDLPDEPVAVIGDDARLHQMLANLLANARTHTPEGTSVTVGVAAEQDHAVLRVADQGPGIPTALLPHIFERFARGDSSRSRAAGSTGLGLSIVHAVVTAHRGTVTVSSSPDGTTFTVRLPLAPDSGGADAAQQDVAQFVQ